MQQYWHGRDLEQLIILTLPLEAMPWLRQLVYGVLLQRLALLHASIYGICGGQSGTWIFFAQSRSTFLYQYHPACAPYSFCNSKADCCYTVHLTQLTQVTCQAGGFGGLVVGSNPAEAVGFFRA
jgi:hypothetical protein